jgi:hypothetical protein
MIQYQTGKRPASYHADTTRYADVRTNLTLSKPKWYPGWGYGHDFKNGAESTGWGMMGNGPCDDGTVAQGTYAYNGVGDCGWAFWSHAFMQEERQAKRPLSRFTSASTLSNYAQYLGLQNYLQIDQSNDQGTDLHEGLTRVQNEGFLDDSNGVHKIVTFASIELGNFWELWEALYLGNSLMLGINFPTSAMDQTNANKIWSVVPGAQIEGGHCIQLVGHPGEGLWTCVTWGQRQLMTQQFLQTYMDEAYIFVTEEQYNSVTGETVQGYTEADLEKYLALL